MPKPSLVSHVVPEVEITGRRHAGAVYRLVFSPPDAFPSTLLTELSNTQRFTLMSHRLSSDSGTFAPGFIDHNSPSDFLSHYSKSPGRSTDEHRDSRQPKRGLYKGIGIIGRPWIWRGTEGAFCERGDGLDDRIPIARRCCYHQRAVAGSVDLTALTK